MRLLGVALFVSFFVSTHSAETVDWRDAARCVGRVCTFKGTVAAQEDEDGVLRLYFDGARRDVSVLLVRSLFVTWPSYAGREIAATGKARSFRDRIEIVVDHPRAVEVAGEVSPTVEPPTASPAPTPAATQAAPPTAEPTPEAEVERLRRQVEQLEKRVRELEGEEN